MTTQQTTARVATLRRLADALTARVEDKRRPMTQNATPKRMREYNSRRYEGDELLRAQRGLRAVADALEAGTLPAILADLRSTKDAAALLHKGLTGAGGYYDVIVSQNYRDTGPRAKALQDLVDDARTPEQRLGDAAKARADKVHALEDAVRFCRIPGFFPTPAAVIDRMLAAADVRPGMSVLEPSAGKGDIAQAIAARHPEARLTLVELASTLRDLLKAKHAAGLLPSAFMATEPDFLNTSADASSLGGQDRIVMNPPFERGQDGDHVRHAYGLLRPGGRLVSVMSPGTFQRSTRKDAEFQEWFESVGGWAEDLPDGSFDGAAAFRSTGVGTRLVTIDR